MTGAYPTTALAMNPEPTDLITADNEYRHEGLDPAKVIGGPLSLRPLSPSPYNSAVPKGPTFSFLDYYRRRLSLT